jgi:hypothetical protein
MTGSKTPTLYSHVLCTGVLFRTASVLKMSQNDG